MTALATVIPVFLIVGLGALLRKLSIIPSGFGATASRLVFHVALPVLLFQKLSETQRFSEGAVEILVILLVGTVVAGASAYPVAWLLRLPKRTVGSFVQASYRGNLAFIGLPIVLSLYENTAPSLPAAAVIAMGPVIVLYNVTAVLVLRFGNHGRRFRPKELLVQIVTNPLIIGIVAGIIWAGIGISLPEVLDQTLSMLGRIALPLALLSVGTTLVETGMGGPIRVPIWSAVLKLVLAPAAGIVTGLLMGVDRAVLTGAVIFLACPSAVASYILAQQLGGDAEMSGGAVVVSTVFSVGTLSLFLVLF